MVGGQRRARFGVAHILAYLLACLVAIGALAACNVDSANVIGGGSTATPTLPPPTATLPASGEPAVLGAPAQAFITKYGTPTNQSNPAQGELHFHQYLNSVTDFLDVQSGKYLDLTRGAEDAATILVTAPPGQAWSVSAARRECAGFGPTDAQFVRSVQTSSQGATVGWDDIYHSDSLAGVFPASAFQDVSQNPVPAGSFDIAYLFASSGDTGHVTSCTLALGERQTVG
jgi:hypothetical protein